MGPEPTYFDPIYKADNDIVQLNLNLKISDKTNVISQTLYTRDSYYASQDYNRFVSNDIFNNSDGLMGYNGNPILISTISPGGYYTDPQLGISKKMLSKDLSRSENDQFYQELRLESSLNERISYSIGANYLKFNTDDKYYVFNNTFTMFAEYFYNRLQDFNDQDSVRTEKCITGIRNECVSVEYAAIDDLKDEGHNYFLSKNVVETESWAVFGELYAGLTDTLNLTVGMRYTDDTKTTTPYPSQLLLGYREGVGGISTGGRVSRGLIPDPDVVQNWTAFTGRAVLDWKPNEDSMIYASYARGYKGGGTNPPRADINPSVVQYLPMKNVFEPEYVDSFEVGGKFNTLDGALMINATAFYSDYKDYQVSQIVDRISLNENFDATTAGVELEVIWRPTRNFRIDGNFGYLMTKIADGETSIDVMNRTQGNDDWVVVRPWAQVPSNCIAPKSIVESVLNNPLTDMGFWLFAPAALCGGAKSFGSFHPDFPSSLEYWQSYFYGITYNPMTDAPNNGRGFDADLSGNELPNAPRWTTNVGAQYTWEIGQSDLTLRADYYRQAESYFRVYNTEYDRLRGWDNLNIAASLEFPQSNLTIQAYVKNVFDDAPIVDAFTNSDDTMLTTNVFTLDPRVFGFSATKRF